MIHLTQELVVRRSDSHGTHCDAIEDVSVDEGIVDHVVTDPPYAEMVDRNTRRGKKTSKGISVPMPLGFDPATLEKRARWARWMATAARKFVIVFSDHDGSTDWRAHLEAAGLEFCRYALWVRTWETELTPERPRLSGAPQFTGAYPAQGHEVIVVARKRPSVRWLGGGKAAVYTSPIVKLSDRIHTTQKPLSLMADILRDFCRPGERIIDPFCGSGTTLVAAKTLGIPAFGIDCDRMYADYAARRAAGARPGA